MLMNDQVQVAVGVLVNTAGQVLLAKRAEKVHQGGLWEFPGGKCAPGESASQALQRELYEELGVVVRQCRPLILIRHQYADRQLALQVYKVTAWDNEPSGREGQPICWVDPQQLVKYPMPAANESIIRAIQLPDRYLITPAILTEASHFLRELDLALAQGARLIQFRVFGEQSEIYAELVLSAVDVCRAAGADLVLNASVAQAQSLGVDGVHLNNRRLWTCQARPTSFRWLAASCHNMADIQQAERIGADFVVLSPVCTTPSHPDAQTLGWEQFAAWAAGATIPVYALGGMMDDKLPIALKFGAQGIAGIRGLWPGFVK